MFVSSFFWFRYQPSRRTTNRVPFLRPLLSSFFCPWKKGKILFNMLLIKQPESLKMSKLCETLDTVTLFLKKKNFKVLMKKKQQFSIIYLLFFFNLKLSNEKTRLRNILKFHNKNIKHKNRIKITSNERYEIKFIFAPIGIKQQKMNIICFTNEIKNVIIDIKFIFKIIKKRGNWIKTSVFINMK